MHVRDLLEPIRDNEDFQVAVRNVGTGPKTAVSVIFKGDCSLDAIFSRLWERLKLFWTSHVSWYLLEPIKDIDGFKGAVRNINNGQKGPKWRKGSFQRRWQSLTDPV